VTATAQPGGLDPPGLDQEGRRLLWRCRRGMKELDVLLERYVRSQLSNASREERQTLTRLLDLPDPELADYLFGHTPATEPHLARLVAAIRDTQVGEYR
jgi:antitoxin CptB